MSEIKQLETIKQLGKTLKNTIDNDINDDKVFSEIDIINNEVKSYLKKGKKKEHNKKYYDKNKEILKEKQLNIGKKQCKNCSSLVLSKHLDRHMRSNKCKNFNIKKLKKEIIEIIDTEIDKFNSMSEFKKDMYGLIDETYNNDLNTDDDESMLWFKTIVDKINENF